MPKPRLRTCTVKRGRVRFNEVIITSQPETELVVLAALAPELGLYVWTCSYAAIKADSGTQHPGYSLSPSSFAVDTPPAFVRGEQLFPREAFDQGEWDKAVLASTNTKNHRVRVLLESIGFFS